MAQLSVIVEGSQLLLRQGEGLIESGGQLRFDFEALENHREKPASVEHPLATAEMMKQVSTTDERSLEETLRSAADYEDQGNLQAAIEMYRVAIVSGGPLPDLCFELAELLYRTGDLTAARERYFMAIELNEDYVEARANLGCVLAELGQHELAVSAFEGTLLYHAEYPDVHYHLARTLDDLDRPRDAEKHWRDFLQLAPDSPWADEARDRLGEGDGGD